MALDPSYVNGGQVQCTSFFFQKKLIKIHIYKNAEETNLVPCPTTLTQKLNSLCLAKYAEVPLASDPTTPPYDSIPLIGTQGS